MRVQLRRLGPQPQIKELPVNGKDSKWTAGRGSNSDIYTLSRFASRTHFSIIYKREQFYIIDHGSSNGTFVNDQKIHSQQEYALPINSVISVGVLSVHQNEPDCIVLAFEQCKEEQTARTVECHPEEVKAVGQENIDIEKGPRKIDYDKDSQQQGGMVVIARPSHNISTLAAGREFKIEEIDIRDHLASNDNPESNSSQKRQEEEVIPIKSEPVYGVPSNSKLTSKQADMITVKEELDCCHASNNIDNNAIGPEKDLFDPEGYADDEIVHAFEAQTQEDEALTRNSQLSYSISEDFIEISDTEDDIMNNIKIEGGNISFIKPELIDLDDYDDEVICLDTITSNKENNPEIPEIKIEDDDAYTDTDKKWFGKLFKTEEECCSFIESQRGNTDYRDFGESNDDWLEYVTNCAEEIGQILLAEDKGKDGEEKVAAEDNESSNDAKREDSFSLDKPARDYNNCAVTGLLTLSTENQKEIPVESNTSPKNVKKRSYAASTDEKTSITPKRIKLPDPYEFRDDYIFPISSKEKSEHDLSFPGISNKAPDADGQFNVTKIFRDFKSAVPKRSFRKTRRRKVESLPASEKRRIKDYRRKKLRELCSREAPKEDRTVQAHKVLPPLRVKITRESRNEYLCRQITGEKKFEFCDNQASGELEKTEGKSDSTENEVAPGCQDKSPVRNDLRQKVPLINNSEEENRISRDRVLCDRFAVNEIENINNINRKVTHGFGRAVKSCLKKFGCSFMKSNKPLVPLKTVRFKNIHTIRYYETENKITRKTSSIIQNNLHNMTQTAKIFEIRSIIANICNWNAAWLEECKRALNSELPPVFSQLKNVPRKFRNHESYVKTFIPLLLFELWHSISERWKACSNGMYRFPAVLTSYSEIMYCEGGNIGLIRCESFAEVSLGVPFYVREGDLVMIQLTKKPAEVTADGSKKLVCRILGYIQKKTTVNADPSFIHASLIEKNTTFQSDKIMRLEILVTHRPELLQNSSNCFMLTGIYHIDSQLMQCQAVCMLPVSPVCKSILSPDQREMTLSNDLCNETLIFNGPLDDLQRELILKLLSSCINRDFNLLQIQGGPGTGKTHLLIAFILQLLYTKQWKAFSPPKILYCAHSNVVVDDMALKLKNYRQTLNQTSRYKLVRFGHLNAMKSTVRDISTSSLGLKNDHHMNIANKTKALDEEINILVADLQKSKTLSKFDADEKSSRLHTCVRERDMLKNSKPVYIPGQRPSYPSECAILENADVICTTCLAGGSKIMLDVFERIKAKDPKQKVICIVDEAMQIKESEAIVPLQLGVTDIILAGDSRQLRSPVRSEVAQSLGLNQSLYWRLLSTFRHIKDDLSPIITLKNQYRMNSAISAFPNKLFYNNNLKDAGRNQKRYYIDDYVVLIDNGLADSTEGELESRLYTIAVKLIHELLNTMADDIPQGKFGIITCRVQQSKNLKDELFEKLDEKVLSKIEVNPIENVQGQEFDIVLFIFDPNLDCKARANVALTRAKHSLIILTSNPIYTSNRLLSKLIEEAEIRRVSSHVNTYMDGELLKKIVSKNRG